jgi:thioredoxin-like negative regulator of GroEL
VRAAKSLEQVAPEWGRLLGAQALLLQAQKMRAAGEEALPRAVPVLHLALEKDPGNGQILEILIETLIDTIRVDEARRLVDEHFAGEGHAALRHYLLGRSLDVMTDIEAAAREYREALAAGPAYTKALLELARIAIEGEDWEQAAAWLDRAEPEGGTGSRLLLLRGLTEDGLGRPERAREAYEEALALSPENAKARYLLGRLLVRGGEVDAGLELLAAHASEEDQ